MEHMYDHSLFYNHLTLPRFGRNKTGHFDNRWEILYYGVGPELDALSLFGLMVVLIYRHENKGQIIWEEILHSGYQWDMTKYPDLTDCLQFRGGLCHDSFNIGVFIM